MSWSSGSTKPGIAADALNVEWAAPCEATHSAGRGPSDGPCRYGTTSMRSRGAGRIPPGSAAARYASNASVSTAPPRRFGAADEDREAVTAFGQEAVDGDAVASPSGSSAVPFRVIEAGSTAFAVAQSFESSESAAESVPRVVEAGRREQDLVEEAGSAASSGRRTAARASARSARRSASSSRASCRMAGP